MAMTVLALAAGWIGGCGSDEREHEAPSAAERRALDDLPTATPEPESVSGALPQGSVPRDVRGTYVTRAEHSDGLPFAGRWTLELRAHRWSESGPHGEHNTGNLSGDEQRLVFLDDGDCGNEPGVYGYRLEGAALELEPEDSDSCSGREIKLTWSSNPWNRRG